MLVLLTPLRHEDGTTAAWPCAPQIRRPQGEHRQSDFTSFLLPLLPRQLVLPVVAALERLQRLRLVRGRHRSTTSGFLRPPHDRRHRPGHVLRHRG